MILQTKHELKLFSGQVNLDLRDVLGRGAVRVRWALEERLEHLALERKEKRVYKCIVVAHNLVFSFKGMWI